MSPAGTQATYCLSQEILKKKENAVIYELLSDPVWRLFPVLLLNIGLLTLAIIIIVLTDVKIISDRVRLLWL